VLDLAGVEFISDFCLLGFGAKGQGTRLVGLGWDGSRAARCLGGGPAEDREG
jgi:hypothetical protein